MRLLLAAVLMLSSALLAVPAAAEPVSFNWARLRDTAPEQLTLELFGEVGRIMYLRPYQLPDANVGFVRPLRSLIFLSRPRASYRAGVCETDWVTVHFEPAPLSLGSDPEMLPHHFDVSTLFIVQDLAKVREGGPSVDEMQELEAACATIDPRDGFTIVASTAFDVTGTIGPLADLIDAARRGRATGPLECSDRDGAPMPEAQCLTYLAGLDATRAYFANLSAGCDRGEAGVSCRNVKVHDIGDGVSISFEFRRGVETPSLIRVVPEPDLSAIQIR